MKLEGLLLRKGEIPINRKTAFLVPIHPRLLADDIRLDLDIAHRVFPEAAGQWYEDLQRYYEALEDGLEKVWIKKVFLRGEPHIEYDRVRGRQVVMPLGIWDDLTYTSENGFARCLSINRDAGGSLNLDHTDKEHVAVGLIRFTPEKLAQYQVPNMVSGYVYAYRQHNISHYPGALFLRDWAMLVVNESLRQLFSDLDS